MKTLNTLKILLSSILLAVFFVLPTITKAQCRTDLLLGQNMVVNGDFSQDYTGWTYTPDSDGDLNTGPNGYKNFTGGFSVPGHIFPGTGADMFNFNNAFNNPFNGHTTGAANDKFLMVDGVCVTGIRLYSQANIPVVANTIYYFSVWINSLKDQPNYPGILNFDVNGTNLAAGITAPALGGGSVGGAWVRVTGTWNSGPTPPATVTISIEGNQTIGCGGASGESDFAIDDISFVPGCSFGDPGPQPDLGVDRTLCGTGGTITLNANVPINATTTVTWNDGTTGTGVGAPYTKAITAPGTYSVCVSDGPSCIKADVIVITNTFTPTTSPNANLCGPGTAPLDAVFTGIGTTYQWKLNGSNLPAPSTNRTYTATTPGTYTVDVFSPGCGTVTSGNTIISTSATTAPTTSANGNLCSTNPVPLDAVLTGTGITYQWKLNGTNLPAPSTNKTYSAITPGNYTVDVLLPGCTTTTSGTTVVTSTSPVTPVDAFYCANTGSAIPVTLGATGTNSATFNWYTASTGGSAVNTGASYGISIPDGTTATQIYYVQDETVSSGSVGPTTLFTSGNSDNAMYMSGLGINFTAQQDFSINSFQIPIRNPQTTDLTVSFNYEVVTQAGNALSPAITGTTNTVTVPASTGSYTLFTFTTAGLNIPVASGPNFFLRITGKTANLANHQWEYEARSNLPTPLYPYNSTLSNVVSLTAGRQYGNTVANLYSSLYNWNISAISACSRMPVRAINNCVTPVTWTSFSLIPQDNSCQVMWSTANETNNDYFAIERSIDGVNFEVIGTTKGGGNRVDASNYAFVDYAPLAGISYYRITQHDFDGTASSTVMKPYTKESPLEISTYPNPFLNNTTLLVTAADTEETYTYTIHTVSGKLVETGTGIINQQQTIANNLVKGMYLLSVAGSTDKVTTKIVKQ